eukprot:gene19298-19693_t
MKIILHDYSGHPFQIQMSRELARRGHLVTHVYFSDFQTPRGPLKKTSADPKTFDVIGLSLGQPFQKSTFLKRRSQEIEYGRKLGQMIVEMRPDVVISSNAPLDAQKKILEATRKVPGCGFVFWLQDLYGEAIDRVLRKKLPGVGWAIGAHYKALEAKMLRQSDQIISISEDFTPLLTRRGVNASRINTIENWAPTDEFKFVPNLNREQAADPEAYKPKFIYSGTLGYKHNPDLLLEVAASTDASVFVYSEGVVANELKEKARTRNIANLSVRPW